MNYVRSAPKGVDRDTRERGMEMAKPLTPRSERSRASWGSLMIQVPSRGACPLGKCVRRENHDGRCWPE